MRSLNSIVFCTVVLLSVSTLLPSVGLSQTVSNRVINMDAAYTNRLLKITGVTYQDGANTVVQNTEATSVTTRTTPVYVTEVRTASSRVPTLNVFNFSGALIRGGTATTPVDGISNIQTTNSGIGIIVGNAAISVNAGKVSFDAALQESTQNNNILNYIYYDGAPTVVEAAFDFDLLFLRAAMITDAFLIQERNGNTHFSLEPLGPDGKVISGSNRLVFGGQTDAVPEVDGAVHGRYDWRTGYATAGYQPAQDMAFSVIEALQFFADTSVDESDRVVYGFRVDNNGNADVKFFGLSDNTFDDNPLNPLVVPEPTVMALLSISSMMLLVVRRIRRMF